MPFTSRVRFAMRNPRRRSSKILALYCAAQSVIFGKGTQSPRAAISSPRI
jgi:hypothetical protein